MRVVAKSLGSAISLDFNEHASSIVLRLLYGVLCSVLCGVLCGVACCFNNPSLTLYVVALHRLGS